MRFLLTGILLLSFTLSLSAQVDRKEKKSIRIPAVESKEKKDSSDTKTDKDIKTKTGIDKGSNKINGLSVKRTNLDFLKPKREFSMFDNNKLKHSGEIYQKRLDKQMENVEAIVQTISDEFLGEYNLKVEFVNIVCRDYGAVDGDLVSISLNDKIIYPRVQLTGNYRRIRIDLENGPNKLDIKALNEGFNSPNTAEFKVYDDLGNLVSSKMWALFTGYKATVVFNNQKPANTKVAEANQEDN